MAGSALAVFDLLGELSGDSIFAEKIRIRADGILVDKEGGKEARLAKVYEDARQELMKRLKGRLRPEDIRRQAAARLADLGGEYAGFRMMFAADEPQLIAIASALLGAYAEGVRRFFGRASTDRLLEKGLADTPWKEVKVSVKEGIAYSPLRMRTVAECGEIISTLFERWYADMRSVLGDGVSRRLFEAAYRETETSIGFLPMMKTLLSLTPRDVLWEEKVRRLHALESETMTQARSIRTADEGLERQSVQLQSTVDELQDTRKRLEIVSSARSEFIDVVAHQFRTPLSTIRWNSELLADGIAEKKIDPQFADPIETVRGKSVYLIETLDRVFATLDIETGKVVLDPKPAFLWEVAQDAYNQYEKDIKRRGIKWKFQRGKEQLREIPMDKAKIGSVLKILIGNAVSYSPDGGTVSASVSDRAVNGVDYQIFTVKDGGIGIPKEEMERVFEKFYRAQPAKLKAPDGTGLGMFIVKNFVEAHRGMVKIDSEGEGKGTTVSIALPVK